MKTTNDTGYKARTSRGKCKKCVNDGAYGIEVSAYGLKQNGISGDENGNSFSGNYCPDHITEDMMEVIEKGDGGKELKNILAPTTTRKTLLVELKQEYGGEPKKAE